MIKNYLLRSYIVLVLFKRKKLCVFIPSISTIYFPLLHYICEGLLMKLLKIKLVKEL